MKIGIYAKPSHDGSETSDSEHVLVGSLDTDAAKLDELPFYIPSGGDYIHFIGNDDNEHGAVISHIVREYDRNGHLVRCEIILRG